MFGSASLHSSHLLCSLKIKSLPSTTVPESVMLEDQKTSDSSELQEVNLHTRSAHHLSQKGTEGKARSKNWELIQSSPRPIPADLSIRINTDPSEQMPSQSEHPEPSSVPFRLQKKSPGCPPRTGFTAGRDFGAQCQP